MKKVSKFIIMSILSVCSTSLYAEGVDIVTLTTTAGGKTKDEAVTNALRSAIEMAFGTFVSSKTEIVNDELMKDEIVSVSSGNVKKFDVVSTTNLPDGTTVVTVKADVSVSKLTKFSESKGVTVEFQGGLFAANIKLQQLYEKNELKSIENLEKIINEILPSCFDYAITVGDPTQSGDKWRIGHRINITVNSNFNNVETIMLNTLKGISMTDDEKKSYDNTGRKYFDFSLQTSSKTEKIWLRNKDSQEKLNFSIFFAITAKMFSCIVRNEVFNVKFEYFDWPWNARNDLLGCISCSGNHKLVTSFKGGSTQFRFDYTMINNNQYGVTCEKGYHRIVSLSLLPKDINSSLIFDTEMPLSDIEKIKKYTVSPYYATNTQQSGYQLTLTSEDVAEASKLFDEGKYEEAIKIYKKGENHPDEDFRSSVNVCIANSYKAMKKYAEAVEAYKKVTSENNQTANYYLVFGQSLYLSGSPEEGIKMLRKSAEMGSEDAKESLKIIAKNTQGTETRLTADEWKQVSNLVKEDKYAEAIKILKKDENDPDEEYRSMINCYIGQQYFSMKKYKEAAEAYQKVSSEKYQDADYYYFLGFSLKKSKKKEEAKKALLKAEEMGSELAKYELLAK